MSKNDLLNTCDNDKFMKQLVACFFRPMDSFTPSYVMDVIIWLYPQFQSITNEQKIILDNWINQHCARPSFGYDPKLLPKNARKLFALLDRISLRNNVADSHPDYVATALKTIIDPWLNADNKKCIKAISKAVHESRSNVVRDLLKELQTYYQDVMKFGTEICNNLKIKMVNKRRPLPKRDKTSSTP